MTDMRSEVIEWLANHELLVVVLEEFGYPINENLNGLDNNDLLDMYIWLRNETGN